ncbi:TetR/AcrR family transcriptional regulator, partial [Marinomonas arenicola]
IRQEVHDADQQRLSALTEMFKRYDFNHIEADVRSRTIYLVQIGYITMQSKESKNTRMLRIAEYIKTFSGRLPQQHELQRFYHRHNYIE